MSLRACSKFLAVPLMNVEFGLLGVIRCGHLAAPLLLHRRRSAWSPSGVMLRHPRMSAFASAARRFETFDARGPYEVITYKVFRTFDGDAGSFQTD